MFVPPLFLANALGWVVAKKRAIAIVIGCVIVGIVLIFAYKGCTKKTVKLDQKEIVEAQQAIEANDRKAMVDVLAKSDAKEAVADDIAVNASANTVNAIKESRDKWNVATDEEIRKELERRAQQ